MQNCGADLQPGRFIDDETAAYIVESRKHFEDLRQVASQLAGLLVLSAAGSKSGGPHHPMLENAGQLYEAAFEGIRTTRPTPRACRHQECLLQAAAELRVAIRAARRSVEVEPILTPLRSAYAALERASAALPGFEMVSFEQGCCGPRRQVAPPQ